MRPRSTRSAKASAVSGASWKVWRERADYPACDDGWPAGAQPIHDLDATIAYLQEDQALPGRSVRVLKRHAVKKPMHLRVGKVSGGARGRRCPVAGNRSGASPDSE